MALSIKRYDGIVQDMIDWMLAHQSGVTDFNSGSVIRSFIEANANELDQIYLMARVGFLRELVAVPQNAFEFAKSPGQKAGGEVVFSRTGTTGVATIPIGVLVATVDALRYVTTELGTISGGSQNSNTVSIQAENVGKKYNVVATSITAIVSQVYGVETVSNAAGTTGGLEAETDNDYLTRFQSFIEGLAKGNLGGLRAGALSISGVRSASVVEHFPPSSGYNTTVYVDDGAGNAPQQMLDDTLALLIGDGSSTNPGYKAGGINLRVVAPSKINIAVVIEVVSDNTVSQDSITYNLQQGIETYVNNLEIGYDVVFNRLIDVTMAVVGVYDITTLTLNAGSVNIGISASQIGRLQTLTITFT